MTRFLQSIFPRGGVILSLAAFPVCGQKKLLSGAMVTSDAKNVTINLSLAASDFREMVQRNLAK